MPALESFARVIHLDPAPAPAGKHIVRHADEQLAARAAETVETWQPPQPKPEPQIVRIRREAAAELKQKAAQADAVANAADDQATQLKHEIVRQEQTVQALERRLTALEAIDFKAQAAAAEATLEAGLENVDNADPSRASERLILQVLRAEKLTDIQARVMKKVRVELTAARKRLADLQK